jgi:hypothetical protein
MTVEQGCFEVTQGLLNTGSHAVTLGAAPTEVVATVRRGQPRPLQGRRLMDKAVSVSGVTVTFSMGHEQVGNCICWTAYLP